MITLKPYSLVEIITVKQLKDTKNILLERRKGFPIKCNGANSESHFLYLCSTFHWKEQI